MYYSPVSLKAVARKTPMHKNLLRHLRGEKDSDHGTQVCEYCKLLAKDLGLLI